MKHYWIVLPFAAALLVGVFAAPARADECNKLTYLTFSAPVTLPGVTLPAGTYRFVHPDCSTLGDILRVTSNDGTTVYGTFLTVPEERLTTSKRPEVVFAEMPSGSPQAIKAWFYPGETTGDGLIYPKHERADIAGAPVQKVFATNGLA